MSDKEHKSKLQKITQALFGSGLELQERLTRTVLFLALIASIIGMGRVVLGAEPLVLTALIAMCLLSGFCLFITVKYRRSKLASWTLVLASNMVLFPMIFLLSGGIESGTPVWFVLGLVYIFLLFKGKELFLALFISYVSFLATYLIAYLKPEFVAPAANRFYSLGDSYSTLMVVSCFVGLLMKIQISTYDREKRLVEKQKEEVEQIARSKDTFFANMSHEIRTPINTIIGLNEMTLREDISEEIAENAINIQNASKMLLTTINDILDLSKLESGKMEIVPTQYEVSAMFSDLVNLIWVRAQQKDLEFKVDIDPEIPSMLYGDEIRVKQIVTNMLTNAVKYTQEGSVTLSAKGERTAPNQFMLRISVIDTGMGIRKDNLDDLFNSFKRVDEKANRNIEGTGLGLSIAKQLIEMMDGSISVDSVYHKGSTFTIELQQRIVNSSPIGTINFAAQRQLSRRSAYKQIFHAPDARILVVDDNDMNRMVVIKLLRGTKIQVDTAASGKECLKKTAENSYHVILMDHMMPEMDGEETLNAVRNQTRGFCQKTPIIALTANVMSNADQIYQNMGFDGYLAKPINASLLEASLLQYLPSELVEYLSTDELQDADDMEISQIISARKRKIAITADCICDLPKEWLTKLQIRLMYCYVHTNKGRFCDLFEVSSDSLLNYLSQEGNYAHSSTAPVAEYEYFFADALETAEHVIHITATTSLSGAYPNALQASQSFDNVTVVNSTHISSGHGIMVLYAATLAEQGKGIQEICDALEQFQNHVFSNFLVPSTETLCRNKKVSGTVNKLCTLLNLHPILAMKQNKLKLWKIEAGNMKRVVRHYVKILLKHNKQIDTRLLFVTYAGCSVHQIDEILEEVNRYARFEHVILQKASATVSSNCGVGTFGLMFFRK
ncbi:MAG: DegV family EDD domain-containing protein [Lachnoclostridium sp.]|nr:DegV family EDD domain-containing protein [Lachnospira sp.]MCM1248523.1 DegV family EDD domain-containing protein [Lachnoclostridium sp.]MCM1535315.1 DegV family EDD domain-containing protein [Clostridium sp.]